MVALRACLVALLVVGCVDNNPEFPFDDGGTGDDGGAGDGELVQCAPIACTLPPDEFGTQVNLLPAIAAQVDNNSVADLVVANSPDDSSAWGFFLVRNVADQSGELLATPFQGTTRRPQAIHVEEGNPTRIFVFGTDAKGSSGVDIYRYNDATVGFVKETVVDGIDTPGVDEAGIPGAIVNVGQLDGRSSLSKPDIVVAVGSQLYRSFCDDDGCSPFASIAIADDGVSISGTSPFPAGKFIRGLEMRPSQTMGNFDSDGTDEILLAGDGNVRWVSYAGLNGDGDAKWRSFFEFGDFSDDGIGADREGVMGTMTGAGSGMLVGQVNALVLGGPGGINVTALGDPGDGIIQPIERYKWASTDLDDLVNPQSITVANLDAAGAPEIVFIDFPMLRTPRLWVLPDLAVFPQPSPDASASNFGEGVIAVKVDLDFENPVSAFVEGSRILVFSADGQCEDLNFDGAAIGTAPNARTCGGN